MERALRSKSLVGNHVLSVCTHLKSDYSCRG